MNVHYHFTILILIKNTTYKANHIRLAFAQCLISNNYNVTLNNEKQLEIYITTKSLVLNRMDSIYLFKVLINLTIIVNII